MTMQPDSDRWTDAEWAAYHAQMALRDGRYRLGLSYARIAYLAHQAESTGTVHMPLGQQLQDAAAEAASLLRERAATTPLFDETRIFQTPATVDEARVLAEASAALGDYQPPPAVTVVGPGEKSRPIPSARCQYAVGDAAPCHGVIFWDAILKSWSHLAGGKDHDPLPPLGMLGAGNG